MARNHDRQTSLMFATVFAAVLIGTSALAAAPSSDPATLGSALANAAAGAVGREVQCKSTPLTPENVNTCRTAVASAIQAPMVQSGATPTVALSGVDRAIALITEQGLYTLPVELAFKDLRTIIIAQLGTGVQPAAIGGVGGGPTIGAPPQAGFSGGQGAGAIYGTAR